MNTPNNKRRRESQDKIEKAFIRLLQHSEMEKVSVSAICTEAGVNRSTFYANYEDVYALGEAVQCRLEQEVLELYKDEREGHYHSYDFLKLFRHIRDNQVFYKTYFKLGQKGGFNAIGLDITLAVERFEGRHIEYHIEFFRNGLNAVIRKWLDGGCRESPEEIEEIIRAEYTAKKV